MAHPDKLLKLALDTFVNYICNLFGKLIEPVSPPNCWRQHVQKINEILQNLIDKTPLSRPNYLTDHFTNKVLTAIDDLLFEVENKKVINKQILISLLNCIVHPVVRRIEPVSDLLQCSDMFQNAKFRSAVMNIILARDMNFNNKVTVLQCLCCRKQTFNCMDNRKQVHAEPIEVWQSIQPTAFDMLSKFILLSDHFKITREWYHFEMNSIILSQLQSLEDYRGYCNDELIHVMQNSCKNLKYLMITKGSQVTNNSICSILKFEHLECLNITNTDITSEGVTVLLNRLLEKKETSKLKGLHLNKVYSQHLKILQQLPDLKIITFSIHCFFHEDFSELKNVKNIYGIHASTYSSYLYRIVRVIGNQLVYLNVNIHVLPVAQQESIMNVIGNTCTLLKCLHISSFFNHWEAKPNSKLPGFKSIICLKYTECGRVKIERNAESGLLHFLLSECVNLKKITFTSYYNIESKSHILNTIFKLNLMKNVEEVYWRVIEYVREYYSHEDDVKSSLLLVKNCLNLRVVGGLKVASVHHNSQRVKFVS